MLPVRAVRHTSNPARVAFEGVELLAGGRVPDLHSPVEAGRGEMLPVRAERHADHLVGRGR